MRHTSQRRFAQVQWLAAGPFVVSGGQVMTTKREWVAFGAGMVITSIASYGADLDHSKSRATTGIPAGTVLHKIAKQLGGGHRKGTHSIAASLLAFVPGYLAGVLLAAFAPPEIVSARFALVIGAASALGWWGGIFPDLLTRQGCAVLYPFSQRKYHLLSLKTSPPKWAPGPDGTRPKRGNPMLFGEAMFNGLLVLTALYFAASILAVA